jgi:ankyrin repeat protein
MQYILKEGVFPSPRDAYGVTPLQLAALRGHHACVRALLDAGADAHATDVEGDSALHWAAQGGNEKVHCSLLGEHKQPSASYPESPRDAHWTMPSQFAASLFAARGHRTCVSVLLDYEANTYTVNVKGCSALHWAAKGGNKKSLHPTAKQSIEQDAYTLFMTRSIALLLEAVLRSILLQSCALAGRATST